MGQSEGAPPPRYPRRFTLDLSQDDHDALLAARYADRVPMADRLRSLLSLWREDPALAKAVNIRAQELPASPSGLTGPHSRTAIDTGGPPVS